MSRVENLHDLFMVTVGMWIGVDDIYNFNNIYAPTPFAIQFFVLLYGMTGNPIYDSTFCFYAVAVAINISFTSNMRGRI